MLIAGGAEVPAAACGESAKGAGNLWRQEQTRAGAAQVRVEQYTGGTVQQAQQSCMPQRLANHVLSWVNVAVGNETSLTHPCVAGDDLEQRCFVDCRLFHR